MPTQKKYNGNHESQTTRTTYPYTLSLRPFGVGIAFSLLASATTAQGYDFAAFQKHSDDRQGQAVLKECPLGCTLEAITALSASAP